MTDESVSTGAEGATESASAETEEAAELAPTEHEQNRVWAWFVVYLKGVAMGGADAVPGVSGGTIALITGIYERLIAALTALDPTVLRATPRLYRPARRTDFVTSLREMDIPFLLVLGAGMVTAVVLLARVVQIALGNFPGPTFAFFFGLIGASALVLADRRWFGDPRAIGAGLAGFSLAFVIVGASGQGALPSSLPVVFVSGVFAISGMVLPGISGAFILLLLGQYDHMTATLNGFVDALVGSVGSGVTDQLLREGAVVSTFLVGAFIGLFTIAYIVRWALERYRNATLAFLVSLMIGSLRLPVIEMADAWEYSPTMGASLLGAGVAGAGLILVLDYYTEELDY